jgi:hypothetical protein
MIGIRNEILSRPGQPRIGHNRPECDMCVEERSHGADP